jgi:DNA-binding NarL/FixJ family response regulator
MQPDMVLVAGAGENDNALELFRRHTPDIALIDVQLNPMNGMGAISAIRSEFPQARIVALANREADVPAARALQAGAAAYVLKNAPPQELLEAIRVVRAGRRHVSHAIALELAQHAADDHLTAREIQVLQHAAHGGFDHRIAIELSLSVDTVKAHMKNVRAKLRANSRTHAVSIALRRGIFDL